MSNKIDNGVPMSELFRLLADAAGAPAASSIRLMEGLSELMSSMHLEPSALMLGIQRRGGETGISATYRPTIDVKSPDGTIVPLEDYLRDNPLPSGSLMSYEERQAARPKNTEEWRKRIEGQENQTMASTTSDLYGKMR